MGIIDLLPIVVTGVEVFKRFIPKKTGKWANPVMALMFGLGGAYATGGTESLIDGLAAAVGAVGAYKIPKEIGKKVVPQE